MLFSKLKGKRFLVTGHTGFKGAWLVAWLRELGATVSGIALDPLPGRGVFKDILNSDDLKDDIRQDMRHARDFDGAIKLVDPEIVFHLAAQPLVLKSYSDPVETFETNVMGTTYLLESLRKVRNLQGLICITTDKVYENKESPNGYVETDQLGGYDPYSASKAACEVVIASYARSFFNKEKIPIIAVRAGNVIGGGDWADNRIVPDFFRAVESRQTLEMRSPSSVRPWQHVMEPLSGYLTVADAILTGKIREYEAYNFGPKKDAQVPVAQIVDGLNAARAASDTGQKVAVRYVDPKHHETSLLWLNCEKARANLGWQPRLDIGTTLKLTSEFYLENLAGASKTTMRELMTSQIRGYMERMTTLD